jgi:hypothetical protein
VIILDANVLLIDRRYQRDPNYAVNRAALDALAASGASLGITTQALYEVVGVMSYQLSRPLIEALPEAIQTEYRLTVIPNPDSVTDYAGCTYADIMWQLVQQMSLGDAVQAIQIRKFAPQGSILLTWDARHFVGKVTVPVFTPKDWLAARGGTP